METKQKAEKRLRETEKLVLEVLIEKPITRDDDKLLVWMVWGKQFERLDRYTLEMFRNAFLGGMLINPDTITRSRRKIQKSHEHLRGILYGNRSGLLETVYRHYYGDTPPIQQELFSGKFKEMAIAANMYESIIGREA